MSFTESLKYLDVLLRIDSTSVKLRRMLAPVNPSRRIPPRDNSVEINKLYIELGELVNQALHIKNGEHQDSTPPPSSPPPPTMSNMNVYDIKSLMLMAESLGNELRRLVDAHDFTSAKMMCLRMYRAIDGYERRRR